MLRAVPGQICHVAVDIRQSNRADKVQIHIEDRNFGKLRGTGNKPALNFQKAEEIPQIEKILIDRSAGVTFDRFMVY